MKSSNISGNIPALVTPFEKNGAFDATAYKKFIEAKPDPEAKMELASLLLQQKNVDEAKSVLSGVDLSTITNPYVLYNLGVGFYNGGQAAEAIKYWEKATTLDPKMTDAWLQLPQLIRR